MVGRPAHVEGLPRLGPGGSEGLHNLGRTAATDVAAEPGDPHARALRRLLTHSWGKSPDRDEQLFVPLTDTGRWKRVRYWLLDHFTGFKYGDDLDALNVVFVQALERERRATVEDCMEQIEDWAFPHAAPFGLEMSEVSALYRPWKDSEVLIHTAEAYIDYGFGAGDFALAWAAYPAYPETCTVYALAIPVRGQRRLALKVRERFVEEGFSRLEPRTIERPYRHPD